MKRTAVLFLVALLLALPLTAALAEDASLSAARAYTGESATLTERDREGNYEELELRDNDFSYDVLIDTRSGAVCHVETKALTLRLSEQATLAEADARLTVASQQPDAAIHYALLEKDDGRYGWQVFATQGTDALVCTLNAETGEVVETDLFPGAAENLLTADSLVIALCEAKGDVTVTALELDWDDRQDTLVYSGEATLNGARYEFEIDATLGTFLEWKLD